MDGKKSTILISLTALLIFAFVVSFGTVQSGEELKGKEIFQDKMCDQCHSVDSENIIADISGKYPDLSSLKKEYTSENLKGFLMKEEKINNKKHLMKFGGSDEELDALLKWLIKING